eukprot:4368430-Pyramimonas_sp.AAC.1
MPRVAPQDTEELRKFTAEVTNELRAAAAALAGRQPPGGSDESDRKCPLEATTGDVQALCEALGAALTLAEGDE